MINYNISLTKKYVYAEHKNNDVKFLLYFSQFRQRSTPIIMVDIE